MTVAKNDFGTPRRTHRAADFVQTFGGMDDQGFLRRDRLAIVRTDICAAVAIRLDTDTDRHTPFLAANISAYNGPSDFLPTPITAGSKTPAFIRHKEQDKCVLDSLAKIP